MPRKRQFTKDMIVDAAFKVIREQGWPSLSARTIASELRSSTMPIYSCLKSMDEIEDKIRSRTYEVLLDYETKKVTENPFLNLAIGYIVFAKEETNLFKFLFLERPKPLSKIEQETLQAKASKALGEDVSLELYFKETSVKGMNDIALKSWIFTHGLAMALSYGVLTDVTQVKIIGLLQEAGQAFVEWAKSKGPNTN